MSIEVDFFLDFMPVYLVINASFKIPFNYTCFDIKMLWESLLLNDNLHNHITDKIPNIRNNDTEYGTNC